MRKIIFCVGLQGSGKTTWAKEQIDKNSNILRINKDSLRDMLNNSKWSKSNEEFILKVRDFIILEGLKNGKTIIIDDTNFGNKHQNHVKELLKTQVGMEDIIIEDQDFTHIPIEVCIERDLKRPNSIGEKIIKKFYNQFLKPTPPKIEYDPKLPEAIIVDCDGTIALFGDKNPYSRDFENDEVNPPIIHILDRYNNYGAKILIVSGRDGKYEEVTKQWLAKNSIPYTELFMRVADDKRKDSIIKQEIYDAHIKGKYKILFVLDDRPQVCRFWYSLGLPLLKVGDPDADF